LGEYYILTADENTDPQAQRLATEKAAAHYAEALRLSKNSDPRLRLGYATALAGAYVRLEQPGPAIGAYEQAIEIDPDTATRWQIEEALSQLYAQSGDRDKALAHAATALSLAPEEERERLQAWIDEVQER
jgi:tetratricopeptide (TPR) repeat protein